MAKLYPPYIEGVLPAFCVNSNGGGEIVIPFAHNKAVSTADINTEGNSMAIKVKTVQNDVLIADLLVPAAYVKDNKIHLLVENGKVNIENLEDAEENKDTWEIVTKRSWKLQIAYIDKTNEIGYYSTVGVIKCTSEPEITIAGFNYNRVNNNTNEFIGVYKQTDDTAEKVYSSEFIITDAQGNLVATSGEILHNTENDENSYTSSDTMLFNRDLTIGEIYKIKYTVTTNNGLVRSSGEYLLTQQKSLNMTLSGNLVAALNYDEGYVDIRLESESNETGIGAFVLSREDQSNPGYWDELYRFTLNYEPIAKRIFTDFTVEQGKTYIYSIQQYNSAKVYSNRKLSKPVYVDFEDMFLFDGERQLKLRFNPQVSSFKTQLSESKTDTIGSKYPFFFRNAKVGYKTFPISGLISMLTDDNQYFTDYDSILRDDLTTERHNVKKDKKNNPNLYTHIDLNARNFASERLFKLKVLDWINNGKVKLFRSPGEGNYLVRLMENSLTPQTQVGRMLHTLNGTAYECGECNWQNLVKYGIIQDTNAVGYSNEVSVAQWGAVSLEDPAVQEVVSRLTSGNITLSALKKEYKKDKKTFPSAIDKILIKNGASSNLLGSGVTTSDLRLLDMLPGTKFKIQYATDTTEEIIIGATGTYIANDIDEISGIYYIEENGNAVTEIVLDEDGNTAKLPLSLNGSITYQYQATDRDSDSFSSVTSITSDIGTYKQLVGNVDIVSQIKTVKGTPVNISMTNCHKRPIEYLYYVSGEIDNIISGEDIYEKEKNSFGYRDLIDGKYKYKLFWEMPSGGLSNYEERVEQLKVLFKKTKNTNGLSEDWWDVQDWADYYAKVNMLQHRIDPRNVSEEDYWQYYPMNYLMYYKSQVALPTYTDVSNMIGGQNGSGTLQMIIQQEDGSWTTHGANCSHSFFQFIPNFKVLDENGNVKKYHDEEHNIYISMQTLSGINDNTKVYIYKPTFPGEVSYRVIEETNETIIDLSQYIGRELGAEYFDDQENMEYSPFSLYVLKNEKVTVNGVEQNILAHLPTSDSIEEQMHISNHLFEKYYIDRYLNAQSAEDMLTERTLLAKTLNDDDSEEAEIVNDSTPLYVLDPWYGKIYEVGKDFMYDPTITYKDANIDLREIQQYSIDNIDPEIDNVLIGNGVYGEVFYQTMIIDYDIEDDIAKEANEMLELTGNDKLTYDTAIQKLKELERSSDYKTKQEQQNIVETFLNVYNELLQDAIENWTSKQ